MWYSILSISAGAVIGANMRWWLGIGCNHWFPDLPMGTLLANLIGAWGIGIALGFFDQATSISPEWRLFLITGLLGALTTFSTFSAEIFTTLQAGKYSLALLSIVLHVVGSVAMTAVGLFMYAVLSKNHLA